MKKREKAVNMLWMTGACASVLAVVFLLLKRYGIIPDGPVLTVVVWVLLVLAFAGIVARVYQIRAGSRENSDSRLK